MVILFGFVAAGTVTNLFPTVVATLGYSSVISLLLTVPPYALAVITSFLNAWHADKTGERYFHITLPLYFAVIAFIIAASTTAVGPRYFAMMLMPAGVYTGYVVALGWISNTLPRPPAKVGHLQLTSTTWLKVCTACRCSRSHQRRLELFVDLRFIHVPRRSRTTIHSRYERELRDGFHGDMYGYVTALHPCQTQQET